MKKCSSCWWLDTACGHGGNFHCLLWQQPIVLFCSTYNGHNRYNNHSQYMPAATAAATTLRHSTAFFISVHDDDLTWWALQIRSRSCLLRNFETTSAPKVKDTPRSFSPQPWTSLSGSDQSKSQRSPENEEYIDRLMRRRQSCIVQSRKAH